MPTRWWPRWRRPAARCWLDRWTSWTSGAWPLIADPVFAVIGIWQPKSHMGAEIVNEPNTYCWSELVTTDTEGAKAFYNAVSVGARRPRARSSSTPSGSSGSAPWAA